MVKLEKEKIKYNELNKKFESKKKWSYSTSWKFKEKKELYNKCQKVIDKENL